MFKGSFCYLFYGPHSDLTGGSVHRQDMTSPGETTYFDAAPVPPGLQSVSERVTDFVEKHSGQGRRLVLVTVGCLLRSVISDRID